jgi:hypothetical protein
VPHWLKTALILLAAVGILAVLPGGESATNSWWSLLPPLVAIAFALAFRDVLIALVVGVWIGTTMVAGGNPAVGFLRFIDTNIRAPSAWSVLSSHWRPRHAARRS